MSSLIVLSPADGQLHWQPVQPDKAAQWLNDLYYAAGKGGDQGHLFTIIDRSSRMLEAVPLTNIKTETYRDALISQWVASYGLPAYLTSDQGAQFTSALWACTCDAIRLPTEQRHGGEEGPQAAQGRPEGTHSRHRLASAPALGPPGHQQCPHEGQRQVSDRDGVQHHPCPSGTTAAGSERPVEEILPNLATATPLPTWHSQRKAPTEPPAALAGEDMVYVWKGGQLQPLAQHYSTAVPTSCWRRDPSIYAWTSVARTRRSP